MPPNCPGPYSPSPPATPRSRRTSCCRKRAATPDAHAAFERIRAALTRFAEQAHIRVTAIVPISALLGYNVVESKAEASGWSGYHGPSLLHLLERLPARPHAVDAPLAFPVQWVETFSSSADTTRGRRVLWGRVGAGRLHAGQAVRVLPSGQRATVAQVLDHARRETNVSAGHSAGVALDRELDISRGDWLVAEPVADAESFDEPALPYPPSQTFEATVAWMDDEPLTPGRVYWALHGHRWIKARVKHVQHRLNIHTLAKEAATELDANAIGHVQITLQEAVPLAAYTRSRTLGAMILVDTASHRTAGAVLVHEPAPTPA